MRRIFAIVAFLSLLLTGCTSNSGNVESSSTSKMPVVDVGAQMACAQWRDNLTKNSSATVAQKVDAAEVVKNYASVSEIPSIASNAKGMFEALRNNDNKAYIKKSRDFRDACISLGN